MLFFSFFIPLAPMTEKLKKYTALFFSGVFNPLLIPAIAYFIILNSLPGIEYYSFKLKALLLSIVLISTCVLPVLFILIASLSPSVNRDMMHHKDRIMPFIFTAFSIFMGAQLIGRLPIPDVFRIFLLGSSLVLIILFFVTLKWKISGHGAGVGGLVGTLLAVTFKYGIDLKWYIIGAIIIAGAVGSSRIYLHKHTPAQVYAGFGVSVLCMYLTIYFF